MIKNVCIISDTHDWHSEKICEELIIKNIHAKKLYFSDISVEIKEELVSFHYLKKPFKFEAVWVRFINQGSIEEITQKLSILHLMQKVGVYVHNSASIIEKTVDKFMCSALFSLNNIKTPKTFVLSNKIMLKEIVLRELKKGPLLLKPLFGSQGKGIQIIKDVNDFEKKVNFEKVFYLQEFLGSLNEHSYSDLRVMVSNHQVVYAVERKSKSFITNAYQGANIKTVKISKQLKKICLKISQILDLGYGGLDFKFFRNDYYLLEVNSIPSWKISQKFSKKSIAESLVNDFVKIALKSSNCE